LPGLFTGIGGVPVERHLKKKTHLTGIGWEEKASSNGCIWNGKLIWGRL